MTRWQRFCALPAKAGRSVARGAAAIARGVGYCVGSITSAIDFRDVMMFGGNGLLGYGLYLIYPPAAFVVPGAIFVAISVFGTR